MTTAVFTSTAASSRLDRIRRYAVARFFIAILFVGGGLTLMNIVTKKWLDDHSVLFIRNLLVLASCVGPYWLYVRWIEGRRASELAVTGVSKEFFCGIVLGLALFCSVIGVLSLAGAFHVTGYNSWIIMLPWIPKFLIGAIFEELLFRAIVFRMAEQSLGSVLALLISSLLFGFAHSFNPGATIFSSVAIALEAGFLFGAVYMLTHRLAMCVGLHAAWNFAQGGIFGVAVSGKSAKGWMQSGLHGPDWLTGGVFGAEASLVAVLMLVAVGAYIFWLVKQRGLLKLPYWKANLSLAF